jgi:hypothetical protein
VRSLLIEEKKYESPRSRRPRSFEIEVIEFDKENELMVAEEVNCRRSNLRVEVWFSVNEFDAPGLPFGLESVVDMSHRLLRSELKFR